MKFWQKVKRSLSGRGNCQTSKIVQTGKIIKAAGKKPEKGGGKYEKFHGVIESTVGKR